MTIGTLTMKHRAPPEVLEQEAAGDRAEADAEAGHAGPDADRLAPLGRVGEHVGDDRQRRRHDERAADAHERPGGDQLRRPTVASADSDRADAEDARPNVRHR